MLIPPHDLRKADFTRSIRGYEPVEVNEYIDFLIDKYTEVYTQCDNYERKLRLIAQRIEGIQSEEEAVKKMTMSAHKDRDDIISEAKKQADKIIANANVKSGSIITDTSAIVGDIASRISKKAEIHINEAEEKAESLLLSARRHCASVLVEFKKEIDTQKNELIKSRDAAEEFNSTLFKMYKEHLSFINIGLPTVENEGDLIKSDLLDKLMSEIKNDAIKLAESSNDNNFSINSELSELSASVTRLKSFEAQEEKFSTEQKQITVGQQSDEDLKTAVGKFITVPSSIANHEVNLNDSGVKVAVKEQLYSNTVEKIETKSAINPQNPSLYSEKNKLPDDNEKIKNNGTSSKIDEINVNSNSFIDEDEIVIIDKPKKKGIFAIFDKLGQKKNHNGDSDDDEDSEDDEDFFDLEDEPQKKSKNIFDDNAK